MTKKKAIIDEMLGGSVDVEHDMPMEDAEPVHEALRSYGVDVKGGTEHGIRVGMSVLYVGRGHNDVRGRIGIVRWMRHNQMHRLEVRVDYDADVNRTGSGRFWDIFVGRETFHLAEVRDSILMLNHTTAEALNDPTEDYSVVLDPKLKGIDANQEGLTIKPSWPWPKHPRPLFDAENDIQYPEPKMTTGGVRYNLGEVKWSDGTTEVGHITPRTRDDVIDEARGLISGDRAAAYGDPRDDFERIAKMWSAIFGVDIPAEKVALAMVAIKMSRISQNVSHRDSWVDIIGYAGLGAEVAGVEKKQ